MYVWMVLVWEVERGEGAVFNIRELFVFIPALIYNRVKNIRNREHNIEWKENNTAFYGPGVESGLTSSLGANVFKNIVCKR